MTASRKIALFCSGIICVLLLFLVPLAKWIPWAVIPAYILYGIIAILFFYLIIILFKNAKRIFRAFIILEVLVAIYICLISLSIADSPNSILRTKINNVYFFEKRKWFQNDFPILIVYEHQSLMPILTRRLQINDNADDLNIIERYDSIFIHNRTNDNLFYLERNIADDWKLIKIK